MHARVKISEKVADLDVTIALTMKLSEWRDMMRQMPTAYPAGAVGNLIAESVGKIAKATDLLVDAPEAG
jgi:hypothetical protein